MDATSENRPGETELVPSIRAVGLWKNSGQAGERLALLVLEAADPRGPDATRSGSTAGNRSGQGHFANVARLGHIWLRALNGIASNVPSCDSDKEMLRRSVDGHDHAIL